jgi:hypothetical protein
MEYRSCEILTILDSQGRLTSGSQEQNEGDPGEIDVNWEVLTLL